MLRCVCAIFGSLTVWHWWEISFVECSRIAIGVLHYRRRRRRRLLLSFVVVFASWGVCKPNPRRTNELYYKIQFQEFASSRYEQKHWSKKITAKKKWNSELNAIINLISPASSSFVFAAPGKNAEEAKMKKQAKISKLSKILIIILKVYSLLF